MCTCCPLCQLRFNDLLYPSPILSPPQHLAQCCLAVPRQGAVTHDAYSEVKSDINTLGVASTMTAVVHPIYTVSKNVAA